ncbi:hypothetical protein [Bradyrhizobium sp.]|uniref:hypothetical protein n=1 Tax=Bradyrhizobium sp. TaxID=376 RepID=UPI00261F4DFE|nr:hypothetical protein [Bradyrhizobium sp.]
MKVASRGFQPREGREVAIVRRVARPPLAYFVLLRPVRALIGSAGGLTNPSGRTGFVPGRVLARGEYEGLPASCPT